MAVDGDNMTDPMVSLPSVVTPKNSPTPDEGALDMVKEPSNNDAGS
jgi:hypothetical protein